jgi:aconitate hydratase
MLQFLQTRREHVAVPTSIHCDHLIRADVDGPTDLRTALGENAEIYDFLRSAAQRFGADFWEPGAGIIHQVVLEHYAFPGALIIGTDSHTPNAGGLGACAVGAGGADAVEVIAGLPWELRYPRRIAIVLTGTLGGWTAPKDVILRVASELGVAGGTNAILEYIGSGARAISATGKATITNMGAELGATTSVFPADARMLAYLRATGRGDVAAAVERHMDLLAPDPEAEAEPEGFYDRVLTIDLTTLEPHVTGPHSPDRARPISHLAAEVRAAERGFPDPIAAALIGSCTNSSYEDMSRAADVATQAIARGTRTASPFLVTPGSEQVRATIARDGQLAELEKVGATVLANACGPCIGQWKRSDVGKDEANTIVSSFNRNFPGRNDGSQATLSFLTSPEIVTALAFAGTLEFDPVHGTMTTPEGKAFRFTPPEGEELPRQGFARGEEGYEAPAADGATVQVVIRPDSERLQILAPFPRWDGKDFDRLPILVKTKGKTTTDHISPAGAWLRFRGHLDKISDNMFLGAQNAFTGETGKGVNVLTAEAGVLFTKIARDWKSKGVSWVVIGDENYGEGSSREHAAMSPRYLGAKMVLVKSFARIHETNLKKQGILPLTFTDPKDYDLFEQADRVSVVGLSALAPGRPVEVRISKPDGRTVTIQTRHSLTEEHIGWFRAGSALNALS